MANVFVDGLEQECRVLPQICLTYEQIVQPRGITREILTRVETLRVAMVAASANTGQTTASKEDLTEREAQRKEVLHASLRVIQKAAVNGYGEGHPMLKVFYVGDPWNRSTATLLKRADEIAANWDAHLPALTKGGALPSDLEEMKQLAELLRNTDTNQEKAKRQTKPEATATLKKTMSDLIELLDWIQGVAEVALSKNPVALTELANAKKLRYRPAGRGGDENQPPPAPPPNSPTK